MSEEYTAVVNHLTRIILHLIEEPALFAEVNLPVSPSADNVRLLGQRLKERTGRVAAMMEALEDKGFIFRFHKDRIFAESNEVEAQEAKKYLLALGFHDTEFQVFLEYVRKWGML
ncbi:MAG: hypothetical protein P4N41_18415 [Negativicutes bacterium]|nr:hypothetical protein [Negativicutes bacterium]